MFDIFTHTIKIITDTTQRWTTKSAVVILILFGLWFLNNAFDFVYSFRANNRLQQLESIGQLLKDTTLTKEQINLLLTERQSIFVRETAVDKVHSFLNSLPNPISLIKKRTAERPDTIKLNSQKYLEGQDDESASATTRNYWWNFVSSNAFILLIMLLVPFNVPYEKNSIWVTMVGYVVMYGALFLVCGFIAYLFGLIPIIGGTPWINYVLNFSLQLFLWMIIGFSMPKILRNKG
ncbi:MAG: hypothetical protein R2804_04375 [Cyclobacteriaceae bacterium]